MATTQTTKITDLIDKKDVFPYDGMKTTGIITLMPTHVRMKGSMEVKKYYNPRTEKWHGMIAPGSNTANGVDFRPMVLGARNFDLSIPAEAKEWHQLKDHKQIGGKMTETTMWNGTDSWYSYTDSEEASLLEWNASEQEDEALDYVRTLKPEKGADGRYTRNPNDMRMLALSFTLNPNNMTDEEIYLHLRKIAKQKLSKKGAENPIVAAMKNREHTMRLALIQRCFNTGIMREITGIGIQDEFNRVLGMTRYDVVDYLKDNPEQAAQLDLASKKKDKSWVTASTGAADVDIEALRITAKNLGIKAIHLLSKEKLQEKIAAVQAERKAEEKVAEVEHT